MKYEESTDREMAEEGVDVCVCVCGGGEGEGRYRTALSIVQQPSSKLAVSELWQTSNTSGNHQNLSSLAKSISKRMVSK